MEPTGYSVCVSLCDGAILTSGVLIELSLHCGVGWVPNSPKSHSRNEFLYDDPRPLSFFCGDPHLGTPYDPMDLRGGCLSTHVAPTPLLAFSCVLQMFTIDQIFLLTIDWDPHVNEYVPLVLLVDDDGGGMG